MRLCMFGTAVLAMAAVAGASPVGAGVSTGNSFTQTWYNTNPDSPLGTFNGLAIEFVSQSPAQTQFENPVVYRENGWSTVGGDSNVTFGAGPANALVWFDITFFGNTSDTIAWNIWYYLDGVKLGGYRYDGQGVQSGYTFTQLGTVNQPSMVMIPLPAEAAMAGFGLLGLSGIRCVRRRRA